MTIEYQSRVFTVEATGNGQEPYRLVGKRGSMLSLVPVTCSASLFWVKRADGRINGGYVGLLSDGSLLWLPQSGASAPAAQRLYRERRAA